MTNFIILILTLETKTHQRAALCQKQPVHVVDDKRDGIIHNLTKNACPSIIPVVMVTKIVSCLRTNVNNNVLRKSVRIRNTLIMPICQNMKFIFNQKAYASIDYVDRFEKN